jgi:selenocysteine lyase/cysteine desulfurase
VNEPTARLRAEFPIVADCVYLNSNSTGAVPRGVEDALHTYWRQLSSWRDEVWYTWLEQLDAYVATLAAFIGAPRGSVVTDLNLTTLLGRIGTCLDFHGHRNQVVISDQEFPTMPFLWRGFARYGAKLVVAGPGGHDYDLESLLHAIDERTALVCVSHGSFRSGALLDLERVVAHAHDHGALVAVDAYQTVGAVPLDVTALDVDFVLGGAHKWMCGTHTAFLYVRPDLLPTLRPAATGWFAGAEHLTFEESSTWAADARRFAGGTPFPLAPLMSRVGLDLLTDVGIDTIRAHSLHLTDRVIERADAAGVDVLTPRAPHRRGGVVALALPRKANDVLAERAMVCSWRGALRIAPHLYNTLDEVDLAMDVIEELRS